MNLRSQICSCCSSATLLLRCSGTSGQTLGDGVVNAPDRRKCVQERPAVWEREAAPLLKCQRSDLILPAAAAPVSLQDTSASATAVPQPRSPALAARTGELRPRCEASRNTWFLNFFLPSPVSWILWKYFCFIVQGKPPPVLCCLLTDELHETRVIRASCRAAGSTSCTTFALFCLHRWVCCFMPGWETLNRHLHDFKIARQSGGFVKWLICSLSIWTLLKLTQFSSSNTKPVWQYRCFHSK